MNNAMIKEHSASFLTFLGLLLALGSIITIAILDRPLADRQPVSFMVSTGDSLVGTYYPGTDHISGITHRSFDSSKQSRQSIRFLQCLDG